MVVIGRVRILLVLLPWFLASGAPWDLVQVLGWMKMFSRYSQIMSLSSALEKTLSGEMCGVCEVVSHAKGQASERPTAPPLSLNGKLLLVLLPVSRVVVTPAAPVRWSPVAEALASRGRARPLLTPPRG